MSVDSEERHPEWLKRLDSKDYFPIAVMTMGELIIDDIIDIRQCEIAAFEDEAFLTISHIEREGDAILSITGALPDGRVLSITREDGVPMSRRKVIRYGKRVHI